MIWQIKRIIVVFNLWLFPIALTIKDSVTWRVWWPTDLAGVRSLAGNNSRTLRDSQELCEVEIYFTMISVLSLLHVRYCITSQYWRYLPQYWHQPVQVSWTTFFTCIFIYTFPHMVFWQKRESSLDYKKVDRWVSGIPAIISIAGLEAVLYALNNLSLCPLHAPTRTCLFIFVRIATGGA